MIAMKKIFVIGHGGYAKGTKENIEMIVGDISNFVFIYYNIKKSRRYLKCRKYN